MTGVTTIWESVLKGFTIRKVENHWLTVTNGCRLPYRCLERSQTSASVSSPFNCWTSLQPLIFPANLYYRLMFCQTGYSRSFAFTINLQIQQGQWGGWAGEEGCLQARWARLEPWYTHRRASSPRRCSLPLNLHHDKWMPPRINKYHVLKARIHLSIHTKQLARNSKNMNLV